MSRYVIEDSPHRLLVVGWDPPLGTFFAQDFKAVLPHEEEELRWNVGDFPREVRTLHDLIGILQAQGYGDDPIPNDIRAKLIADESTPWEPGPLQRRLGFLGKDTPV